MEPVKSDPSTARQSPEPTSNRGDTLLIVKIGGGLLTEPGVLHRVAGALAQVARRREMVVIPGGGPFADAVRGFEQAHGLSPDAAHWMAILAMDQYAYALADHIPNARVVDDRPGILAALTEGAVPVLAPYRWLRAADELPHTWDVTSDSLAAYLTTLLGAGELVLVKPARRRGGTGGSVLQARPGGWDTLASSQRLRGGGGQGNQRMTTGVLLGDRTASPSCRTKASST